MKIRTLGEKYSVREDIKRDGRHLKVTPILQISCEDSDFLTDRGADITFLSVSSKQIYTRSIGCHKSISSKNPKNSFVCNFPNFFTTKADYIGMDAGREKKN